MLKTIKRKHPHNAIILSDGRTLECYPFHRNYNVASEGVEREKRLFTDNVFYLWEHRERILTDSRMFLCPIHINNNLAYIANSSMSNATLGCYIEWWQSCKAARRINKKGRLSFIYGIGGSPLSGGNHCAEVYANGKTNTVHIVPFVDLWRPFLNICEQYAEASNMYQSFTLTEVIERLKHKDETLLPPLTKEYVRKRFNAYNDLYFSGKLSKPQFKFSTSKRPWGMYRLDGDGSAIIWLSRSVKWTEPFLKKVLIHEMVHQYCHEYLHSSTYGLWGHGLRFHYVKWQLKRKYGVTIS